MSAQKGYPIKGYWIKYNPRTHQGAVWLNMDNDPQPELNLQNLSAEDVAAMAAILNSGRALYLPDGSIMMEQ